MEVAPGNGMYQAFFNYTVSDGFPDQAAAGVAKVTVYESFAAPFLFDVQD
jgi:hypothetical protein